MNINFEYYRVFCSVAENKSVTEAAKRLNISQPAISKTIKFLESEINCSLFYRAHGGMSLTPEGEKLYTYIKPIILQIDETENIMSEIISNGKTNIRIGTSITVLRLFLIEYIKKYTKEHQNVHIFIEDNTNDNLITKLKEGALDIAVIIFNSCQNDKYSDIKIYKLKELNYAFFCSEEYMPKKKQAINVTEIKNKNFIINKNTTELNRFHQKYDLNNFLSVASNSFIFDFVKCSVGIGLIIKEFAQNIDGIYEIKLKEELPKTELVALTNNNKYHNIAISHFINGLIKDE